MIYLYISIYRALKKDERRGLPLEELGKIKRALFTTLIILSLFMLCWLPMFTLEIALLIQVEINPLAIEKLFFFLLKADQHLYNLLLLNSFLDPIIFLIRVPDVRLGCLRMFFGRWPSLYQSLSIRFVHRQPQGVNGYLADLGASRASLTSVTAVGGRMEHSNSMASVRTCATLTNNGTVLFQRDPASTLFSKRSAH